MAVLSAASILLAGLVSTGLCSRIPHINATFGDSPVSFQLKVDQAFIDNVLARVENTRAPVAISDLTPEDSDGASISDFNAIRDYWVSSYDWDATQASINKDFKQHTTTVQSPNSNYTHPVPLHFVHHKSSRKDAIPLLFIHGWPGSFLEVGRILEPLTNPPNSSLPAFHVVAPSVPGFGFSPAADHDGYGPIEAAHSFDALMQQLGYPKYVLQAGDLGGVILRYQCALFPDNVVSALSNFWLTQPNEDDYARYAARETDEDESEYMSRVENYKTQNSGYRLIHETKPLQLAYALTDSPVGFTMWIYTLMKIAVDPSLYTWTPQEIITWSMMYYIQGPYGGLRMYKGMNDEGAFDAVEFGHYPYVTQPVAISEFPYDLWYRLPLAWAQREGNVKRRFVHDRGGHFAAHEVPELLVQDIRTWFGDRENSGTKVFSTTVEHEREL